jgi:hypothetical protein
MGYRPLWGERTPTLGLEIPGLNHHAGATTHRDAYSQRFQRKKPTIPTIVAAIEPTITQNAACVP